MGARFSRARKGVEAASAFGEITAKKTETEGGENGEVAGNSSTGKDDQPTAPETKTASAVVENTGPETKQPVAESTEETGSVKKTGTQDDENGGNNIDDEETASETKEATAVNAEPQIEPPVTESDKTETPTTEAVKQPASVQDETALLKEEPTSVKEEPALTKEEPALEREEPVLLNEEPSLIKEEPSLVKEEPALLKEEPASVKEEPALTKEEPALETEEPVLLQREPSLVKEEPALVKADPTPGAIEPVEAALTITDAEEVISKHDTTSEPTEKTLTVNNLIESSPVSPEASLISTESVPEDSSMATVKETQIMQNETVEEKADIIVEENLLETSTNLVETELREPEKIGDKVEDVNIKINEDIKQDQEVKEQTTLKETNSDGIISNGDLTIGDNTTKDSGVFLSLENIEPVNVMDEQEKSTQIVETTSEKKADDLLFLENGDKNGIIPEEKNNTTLDELENKVTNNDISSASLLDFATEEPTNFNNSTPTMEKTDAVDGSALKFEPSGIESISSQDLQFLENSKAQNGSKTEDAVVENLLDF